MTRKRCTNSKRIAAVQIETTAHPSVIFHSMRDALDETLRAALIERQTGDDLLLHIEIKCQPPEDGEPK